MMREFTRRLLTKFGLIGPALDLTKIEVAKPPVKKSPPQRRARPNFDATLVSELTHLVERGVHAEHVAKISDAYGALGLHSRSLKSLELLAEDDRTPEIWLRFAVVSSRNGDIADCERYLDRIDLQSLGEGQKRRFHALRCQILEERGDYDGVLDYLAPMGPELPISLEARRLDALAQLRRDDEVEVGYLAGMQRADLDIGFVSAAFNFFHLRNNQRQALALALEARTKWPYEEKAIGLLCRVYWAMGDVPALLDVIRAAAGPSMVVNSTVASYVLKAKRLAPDMEKLEEDMLSRLHREAVKDNGMWALDLAHTAALVGRYDIAENVARRYLKSGGIAPLARLVLAMCELADGKRSVAFAEIKALLRQSPQMEVAYPPLFFAAAASEDTSKELSDFFDVRRNKVARYRKVDSFGRRIAQDTELIWLLYLNSNYKRGLLEKVNRRALLSLTHLIPARPPESDFMLPGGRSLFIIADDGVSDEVRWAQHYPEVTRRFERVEASCEPRLYSIMQRSFPEIRFHAVHRMWWGMLKRFQDLREDVPNLEAAIYLDGPTLQKLQEFEKVAFTNELLLSNVLEKGTLTPAEGDGGHLVPDPELKASWAKTIGEMAAGKRRVGILWRSGLIDRKRKRFYFELEALRPLLDLPDCAFFTLQHAASAEEIQWCQENGIQVVEADLFEDFEAVAAITSELDVIVGPSTLPLEMAAAVGTPAIIPGLNLETVGVRLNKGEDARCMHSRNTYVACDPQGYNDPDADYGDRLERVMALVAEEIKTGRYGKGLAGY